ncbi:hypothetical protein NDU88_010883 [Pleurodeles waltl]|uniref:Uncharacterized protein n=1 Tax=Pleurodeles waltl TaxID=8319 RepID=A0AAV7QX79_PLEWA|nr:hypothetical protein NDU88_010883 [Pleurodeles waltl]
MTGRLRKNCVPSRRIGLPMEEVKKGAKRKRAAGSKQKATESNKESQIKEQILSQAIKAKVFKTTNNFSFHVFPDMSISAAQRRCEFVSLIDDFKKLGALIYYEHDSWTRLQDARTQLKDLFLSQEIVNHNTCFQQYYEEREHVGKLLAHYVKKRQNT